MKQPANYTKRERFMVRGRRLGRAAWNLLRAEDGPTAVEYAVMLALIVAACLGTVRAMSNATAASFDNTSTQISNAFGS